MKNRVLVTGACGFIGYHIINELKNYDVEILGVDRIVSNNVVDNVRFLAVDLLKIEELEKVLNDFKPDSIIHLAAIASPTYQNVAELYDINVRGSENLLELIKKTCSPNTRVVLTSTAGVYGVADADYYDEEKTPYNPQNHYSYSKMVMEYISRRYQDKLDIKIIRPFNILGMNQSNNFLIPKLIEAFVNKQEVLRVGNLETSRDFVDVEYSAKLFTQVALQDTIDFNIINICTGQATKGIDIVNYLNEITGYMPKIEIAQEFLRANEIMRMVGNPTRCNEIMKNIAKPKEVKEILENMVIAYKEN